MAGGVLGDRATPEYIGPAAVVGETTGASISISRPTNALQGDLLLMGVTLFSTGLVAGLASAGWVLIASADNTAAGNNHGFGVLARIDDGSAGPYSVTWLGGSTEFYDAVVVAYRAEAGVDTQQIAPQTSLASTVFRGPTLNTANAHASLVLIGVTANIGGGQVLTPPADFAERLDEPDGNRIYVADGVSPLPGATGNKDATQAVADPSTVALVALTPGPRPVPAEFGSHSPGLAGPGAEDLALDAF